ncbi:MAG: hypothetical protein AAB664_02705 [Patescibacteria group bacterium]
MQGLLLTTNPLVSIFFHEPSVILFGLLLIMMTAASVLVLVMNKQPAFVYPFLGLIFLILLTLVGILAFDFSNEVSNLYVTESSRALSEMFSSHRWLLMQVPILLTFITLVIGWVCRKDLEQKHTREYVNAMRVSVFVSFLTILLIGFETLI